MFQLNLLTFDFQQLNGLASRSVRRTLPGPKEWARYQGVLLPGIRHEASNSERRVETFRTARDCMHPDQYRFPAREYAHSPRCQSISNKALQNARLDRGARSARSCKFLLFEKKANFGADPCRLGALRSAFSCRLGKNCIQTP